MGSGKRIVNKREERYDSGRLHGEGVRTKQSLAPGPRMLSPFYSVSGLPVRNSLITFPLGSTMAIGFVTVQKS